jgi:transcriptional regulator with XRE-family HTH domain
VTTGRQVRTSPFGRALRHWRTLRGMSQPALAGAAATTARHPVLLETGRSRPSTEMVERLGDALLIPLRERNRLLEAAGLAPVYEETPLDADDLAPFQLAVERLLTSHDPYPGFVVDRHYDIVATAAGDVTLDELRVELMYPQDEASEWFFRRALGATQP